MAHPAGGGGGNGPRRALLPPGHQQQQQVEDQNQPVDQPQQAGQGQGVDQPQQPQVPAPGVFPVVSGVTSVVDVPDRFVIEGARPRPRQHEGRSVLSALGRFFRRGRHAPAAQPAAPVAPAPAMQAEVQIERQLAIRILQALCEGVLQNQPFLHSTGIFRLSGEGSVVRSALEQLMADFSQLQPDPNAPVGSELIDNLPTMQQIGSLSFDVVASMIKRCFKFTMTEAEKMAFALLAGLTPTELKNAVGPENQVLAEQVIAEFSSPNYQPQISISVAMMLHLSQGIMEHAAINRMKPMNMAICVAPNMMPDGATRIGLIQMTPRFNTLFERLIYDVAGLAIPTDVDDYPTPLAENAQLNQNVETARAAFVVAARELAQAEQPEDDEGSDDEIYQDLGAVAPRPLRRRHTLIRDSLYTPFSNVAQPQEEDDEEESQRQPSPQLPLKPRFRGHPGPGPGGAGAGAGVGGAGAGAGAGDTGAGSGTGSSGGAGGADLQPGAAPPPVRQRQGQLPPPRRARPLSPVRQADRPQAAPVLPPKSDAAKKMQAAAVEEARRTPSPTSPPSRSPSPARRPQAPVAAPRGVRPISPPAQEQAPALRPALRPVVPKPVSKSKPGDAMQSELQALLKKRRERNGESDDKDKS